MKSGRSRAGMRAAGSHTAALAGSEEAVDALFRQAGVIRAATLGELLDVASLLATQPLPRGRSRGGGDERGRARASSARTPARRRGSSCLHWRRRRARRWPRVLPAEASLGNPVDMLGSATAADYEAALPLVLADPTSTR